MKIKHEEQSPLEQAMNYVNACADSVSGQKGGHQFLGVAIHLLENFPLDVAKLALDHYNAHKCQPAWGGKELEHKWEDACAKANVWSPPIVHHKSPVTETPAIKITTHEALPKPLDNATIIHLQTCFSQDEFVNIAVTTADKKPVKGGAAATAGDWIEGLQSGSIYSLFTEEPLAKEENGCYICVNPLSDDEKRSKDNVSAHRHLLVEFDDGTLTEQWNTILSSHLPCAVVINSGGKSIHAWVKVNAKDAKEYAARQKLVYDSLAAYGIDKANSDPCRYSRLAGQKRGDKMQELLAVNIGCKTFEEWEADAKWQILRIKYPKIIPITEFVRPSENDPNELLQHRFLSKEGIAMIIANAGIGKSVIETQLALTWALGKECLGIKPTRKLKSLIVQAEDDAGDIGEMKDSVFGGMNIINGSQAEDIISKNVAVVSLNTVSGMRFFEILEMYLNDFRPDIIWINPVLSYLGGDANSQESVGAFLRNGLSPLLNKYQCAAILIHHSAKPLRDGNAAWSVSNYAQYGLGSVEWGNAARAVLVILEVDETSGTYVMRAAKRGKRLQWEDPFDDAKFTRDRYIRHSKTPGILQWYDASRDEITLALKAQQETKESGFRIHNKNQSNLASEKIFNIIPFAPDSITRTAIAIKADVAPNTVTKHIALFLEEGGVVEHDKKLSRPKILGSQESEIG